MLHPLIFPLFLFIFNTLEAKATCSQAKSCPLQLQENFIQNSLQTIETTQQDKEFQTFLTTSLQQRDNILDSNAFQDVVKTLQTEALKAQTHRVQTHRVQAPLQSSLDKSNPGELTLFVSFSMGEKALLNLVHEAKIYGATLILRGFKDNSYAQTVKALQKIIQKTGQGFIIDPELFSLFSVTAVPTYVLSKPFQLQALEPQVLKPKTLESQTQERTFTPLHDRLQGHVSPQYALETFAKEGDLKEEAKVLLLNASIKKERLQ